MRSESGWGDLLGQPVLVDDGLRNDDVPAIRDALMTPRRLSRTLFKPVAGQRGLISTDRAARIVEYTWADYQRGRLGRVITDLPGLPVTACS